MGWQSSYSSFASSRNHHTLTLQLIAVGQISLAIAVAHVLMPRAGAICLMGFTKTTCRNPRALPFEVHDHLRNQAVRPHGARTCGGDLKWCSWMDFTVGVPVWEGGCQYTRSFDETPQRRQRKAKY